MSIFSLKLPKLQGFTLETYSVKFSLDKISIGVDNIHYDVYLSPGFHKATRKVVLRLLSNYANAKYFLNLDKISNLAKERDEFKRLCRDVLKSGVNKGKLESEIQIDLLAQIAVVKMLIKEIRDQYEKLINQIKNIIRKHDISRHLDMIQAIEIKEKLSDIQQNKKSIFQNVVSELFRYLIDVQREGLNEMREAIFGSDSGLPDNFFSNPILHGENPFDDSLLIGEYVLMGHRSKDYYQYDTLLLQFRSLLDKIIMKDLSIQERSEKIVTTPEEEDEQSEKNNQEVNNQKIDIWLKHVDNIEILFNSFQTRERCKTLKKQKGDKKDLINLKRKAKTQERFLNFFYKKMNKKGLITRIAASFEMKPVYHEYCPPLIPQQVLQFLAEPKQRKDIVRQLKKLKGFYDKSFSLIPLQNIIKHLKKIKTKEKKKYLIRFLNAFARYHVDLQNFNMLKEAMERISLVTEEKIINLSRKNRLLYEFLLPHEQIHEEKPIINHVIIKADVRGSTDLTHLMKERGLNPASYFSLNFFDPINEILSEYAADKVFIEGDAIILSIYEHEDSPEGWYCIARACGLAIKILLIVHQYNMNNRKHELPILELGIGITYNNTQPTFLFDMDTRIMISPAINLADRLSGCEKQLRKLISIKKLPFNLYVFQTVSEEEIAATKDDLFLRYNVNGIALDGNSFKKLSKEIDLKVLKLRLHDLQKEKTKVYTGKFPTVTGKFQRLVIREANICQVAPYDLSIIRPTTRKYYEVCTNPKLYKYVKKIS
jgi:hypothetical protein